MTESTLENLAAIVGKKFKEHGLKLATAESCTGGGVAFFITSVAGSSDWFDRGFVTYSNQAKIEMLGVKKNTLDQYGAVSEQVALEMAEGALKQSGADVSIAITGIAGPDGGTEDKPVGTVWIGWARKGKSTNALLHHYQGDRKKIREQTIADALQELTDAYKYT